MSANDSKGLELGGEASLYSFVCQNVVDYWGLRLRKGYLDRVPVQKRATYILEACDSTFGRFGFQLGGRWKVEQGNNQAPLWVTRELRDGYQALRPSTLVVYGSDSLQEESPD